MKWCERKLDSFGDNRFQSQIVDDTSQRPDVARPTSVIPKLRKRTSAYLSLVTSFRILLDHNSGNFQFAMSGTLEGISCFVTCRRFKQLSHAARFSAHGHGQCVFYFAPFQRLQNRHRTKSFIQNRRVL